MDADALLCTVVLRCQFVAELTNLFIVHSAVLFTAGYYMWGAFLGILAKAPVLFTGLSGTTCQVLLTTAIVVLDVALTPWQREMHRASANHRGQRSSLHR